MLVIVAFKPTKKTSFGSFKEMSESEARHVTEKHVLNWTVARMGNPVLFGKIENEPEAS